ncbi:MAG: hypothetical protein J7M19_06265 [Planctomycetes bacterium]|nr:hypothetical protein [Planctomycetota bacterium]
MTVFQTKSLDDISDAIQAYNDLAERLTESQRALKREVLLLREELAEKNRQLARKNRLAILGEMAAGVAHEIRNPLGGIELYAGLIQRESADAAPQAPPAQRPLPAAKIGKWARRIEDATRDLSRIVGDILDFTRPLEPRMKKVFLSQVAEAALDLADPAPAQNACDHQRREAFAAAGGRLIRVAWDVSDEVPVAGDFQLLQRAFLNVILNAAAAIRASASPQKAGTLTIRVSATRLEDLPAQRIAFEDTGPGIGAGDVEKVFDPFFTTREGGTGLGLAQVARIVAAHGGRITAGNTAAGGAVFSLTFPVAEAARAKEKHQ